MKAIKLRAVDENNFPPVKSLTVDGVRYYFSHQIGVGAFSKVYKATDVWGNNLAVKVYPATTHSGLWQNEVRRLQQFRGPSVAYLHRVFQHEGDIYLVLESAGISVSRCRIDTQEMRVSVAVLIARGLLQVLTRLHHADCFHGDINPQNVLLSSGINQKIEKVALVDFALCQESSALQSRKVQMAKWAPPPEYILQQTMSGSALDIWHLGLLLLQVIKGEILDYSEEDILEEKPLADAQALDLPISRALSAAIARDPAQRPDPISFWCNILLALNASENFT